jgi:membrane protein DedA with SNARE-associated domain
MSTVTAACLLALPPPIPQMAILAAATLLSEDLTCLAAGAMVARGELGFPPAVAACLAGIVAGDLLLYLAGRYLGRPAISRAPLKWILRPEQVRSASEWLSRRGLAVVFVSRFLPGARLPVYFAAGILETSFPAFALWFLLAASLWTPMLVGISARLGQGDLAGIPPFGPAGPVVSLVALALLLVAGKGIGRLASRRGRRLLHASWIRVRRWEYWPPWLFYLPVAGYVLFLGVKHRCATLFTAANPAIPAGGFIAESKSDILGSLQAGGAPVARFRLLRAEHSADRRLAEARDFMDTAGIGYPVVAKPDIGQRGEGVAIIAGEAELAEHLRTVRADLILQEHVGGAELGIFYVRRPGESRGRIFSVTEKHLPSVTGDGRRRLEDLILDDRRLRGMARFFLRRHADRLGEVPAAGEEVLLTGIGNHCRGAVFLDGNRLATPDLEAAVEKIARAYPGFHFGRFDVRAPSREAFRTGTALRILELNGVTSEATEIYDPRNSLRNAYRKLFQQWRLAFEIGAANRARGAVPARPRDLARMLLHYRRRTRRRALSSPAGATTIPA